MDVRDAGATPTPEPEITRGQQVRAAFAATVGTAIEWYDFFLYTSAAALVFDKVFFTHLDPSVGTTLAFATAFFGFVGRPIGAAIFGHYGDRIGRKGTLIATLLVMGIATMLVGLVPGYATIGFGGAIILTVLRVIQGIGVGGEWGGSVLLALEWGHRSNRRGFLTSWPQYGVPVGLFLANLALILFGGNKAWFLTWGWRIPFLLSGLLIVVGLYIRLRVMETPTFKRLAVENRLEKAPLVEVLRLQWPEVLKGWFVRMSEQAPFYIFTTFALAYGTKTLHFSRDFMLYGVMATCVVSFFAYPFFGWLSDVVGRKPVYLAGIVATAVWGFVYFGLLDTRVATIVFIAVAISLIPHDAEYAPQAALISEQFTPRLRYSGAGLSYQLSSLTAGGPAPIIASLLLGWFHSVYAISAYILFCAAVSFIALMPMRDRTREDITKEYAEVGAGRRLEPARRTAVE